VVDIGQSFWAPLPATLLAMLNNGQKAQFDQTMQKLPPKVAAGLAFRARPYGFTSYFDMFQSVKRYVVKDVIARVKTPLLVCDPDNEQFFPGQPKELFAMLPLPTAKKVLVPFTVADGADRHCEPGAPGLRSQKVLDWVDSRIA
jgi:hypothetical protein